MGINNESDNYAEMGPSSHRLRAEELVYGIPTDLPPINPNFVIDFRFEFYYLKVF